VPTIVADLVDARTGELLSLTESATVADGMVINLLRIRRGSGAAVADLGSGLHTLQHVSSESPTLAASLVREALKPAVDAGVLELVGVTTEGLGDTLAVRIEYRDLASRRTRVLRIQE
jgi:hypothetical protein